jgi:hypothetical protein
MMIQKFGCARIALFVELALGFGPAKPRAIGVSLFSSLLARNALPEPLEIDYFSHSHCPVRLKIGKRQQFREGTSNARNQ